MIQHNIRESLLFAGVDRQYVEKFISLLPKKTFKKDAFLWHQGDTGKSMYLLESGKLEVILENASSPYSVIAVIEAGAVIGELCVFGQGSRTASIRAAEDSVLLEVDGDKFCERVHNKDLDVLLISFNIARLLSDRLAVSNQFIRKLHEISDSEKAPVIKSELERYRERFVSESLFN